ncbi:Sulfotransferase family protein [Actibacterium lipolyticum]|uniref:Sulfotransferase family protein n=2 Tax=Actibacterium lipolyticum TaxID=1524263 RepID=A0A238JN99_9RHOB|nr:Sulfotransferase family protein [Actibacterium lipolyticum]
MALALEARAKADDILIGDTPKAVKRRHRLKDVQVSGRLWKHSRLSDIYGLVAQEQVADYFTFTLVRNPWDRMVSYYHWLRGQGFEHPAVRLAKAHDFSAFLNHPHTQASFRTETFGSYMLDQKGQEQCGAFIRLEHLADDIAPLEAHLGFTLDIPHENASDRDGYHGYYSDDDAGMLAKLCAEDIERFGYSF